MVMLEALLLVALGICWINMIEDSIPIPRGDSG
jgi:hypothetical protein